MVYIFPCLKEISDDRHISGILGSEGVARTQGSKATESRLSALSLWRLFPSFWRPARGLSWLLQPAARSHRAWGTPAFGGFHRGF